MKLQGTQFWNKQWILWVFFVSSPKKGRITKWRLENYGDFQFFGTKNHLLTQWNGVWCSLKKQRLWSKIQQFSTAHTHFHIPIIYPSHTHHWPMASYGKFIKYVMPDTTFRDRWCGAKLLWKVTVFLPSMFLLKNPSADFWNPKQVSTVKWLWVKAHLCSSIQFYVSYCRYYPYITMRYHYSHRMTASCS